MAKVGIKKTENEKRALPFTTNYSVPRYPVVRLKDVESFTEEEALEQIYHVTVNNGGIHKISKIVSRFNNNYKRVAKAEFNEANISIVTSLIVEEMEKDTVTNFNMLYNYFHRAMHNWVTKKILSAALRELVEKGYLIKKRLITHEPFIKYCECYIRTDKL